MNIEKYGFIQKQVNHPWFADTECYYMEQEQLLVAATGTLPELSDSELFQQLNCRFLLQVWNEQEEEHLRFYSNTGRVRALEFLDYLIADFGLVKGDAGCAGGQISSAILKVQMAALDLTETMEYFLMRIRSYFKDCDWIDAETYAERNCFEIEHMQQYHKKAIPWAYVKTTDIAAEGRQLCMKSLENESGLMLTVKPDNYIMIGCRGEIYDISRVKFESTYTPTEEPLDIFEQMLDFLPAVETVPEGEYISLDEIAHLCYPKQGSCIYACELQKRTKVFPANKEQEYFLGQPGDYMAIRPDDHSDIYIIQREIFLQSYEEGTV